MNEVLFVHNIDNIPAMFVHGFTNIWQSREENSHGGPGLGA